ncbi:hypothetical protein M0804_015144 [Polistes exclamans]|nr:hypothetical protein M0804_015144 [Polistes exclamans]
MELGTSEEAGPPVHNAVSSNRKKRPGKASKQRSKDAFRLRVGMAKHRENRERKLHSLGVFDESCAELERSLMQMAPTIQRKAIPLPVATRGVGFVSAAEYGRMATTWNLRAITEICTIHQYYRVSLHLKYFKLFQARYGQNEVMTYPVGAPFTVSEELRLVLVTIIQVPVTTANLLSTIERTEGSVVYHSLPAVVDMDVAEHPHISNEYS